MQCREENPLISVIVPIYNVEPYLRKCLDSLINQTYKALQIILVDDGSPDNCGKICDEYSALDSRITVIHKANGGLSSARNAGLNIATGIYLGFVDPDDWIENDMFEYLISGIQTYNADIAICGRREIYSNHSEEFCWDKETFYSKEEALKELLDNKKLRNYVWDKLWRKELFVDINFPEGKTFEDVAVTYRAIINAEYVVCLPAVKYNYRQRSNGIVHSKSAKNVEDHFWADFCRYEDISVKWPQYVLTLKMRCVEDLVEVWWAWAQNMDYTNRHIDEVNKILACFDKVNPDENCFGSLGLAGKLQLKLCRRPSKLSFAISRILACLYQRKHNRYLQNLS